MRAFILIIISVICLTGCCAEMGSIAGEVNTRQITWLYHESKETFSYDKGCVWYLSDSVSRWQVEKSTHLCKAPAHWKIYSNNGEVVVRWPNATIIFHNGEYKAPKRYTQVYGED